MLCSQNLKRYYITKLIFLLMCFCISCTNKPQTIITKFNISYFTPQIPFLKQTEKFYLDLKNKSLVSDQKITNSVLLSLQENLPHMKLVEEKDAQVRITIGIQPQQDKTIQKKITQHRFHNGFANLPIKNTVTKNVVQKIIPVKIIIADEEINYNFYEHKTTVLANNTHQLRNLFKQQKQTSQIFWMQNELDTEAKTILKKGQIEEAIAILSRLISDKENSFNKKKQISLQQMHVLGTLYHNRSSILKILKRNDATTRDQQKAKTIFSFIGNYYDRK
ncbi:hypothetical protein [Candidatus Uabimicrobium sp. HlEnr_7]|uniref:hypothetical protein n=1 Tax=Candidatus Uabimicrobium helgolandensis TaxID=3095367 RepID=UPI0035562CDC